MCQRLRPRTKFEKGISGLENLKSETSSESQESVQMRQFCTTVMSWIHDEWTLTNGTTAGIWMNGMMIGVVLLDGMKISNKRTHFCKLIFT